MVNCDVQHGEVVADEEAWLRGGEKDEATASHRDEVEVPASGVPGRGRRVAVTLGTSAALCLCLALVSLHSGSPTGLLDDVTLKELYKEDPSLVKAFAKASGKVQGAKLMAQLDGAPQRMQQLSQFKTLDSDLQALSGGIINVTKHLEEAIEKPMLPHHINRNAALMVIDDLSSHWDANANYTSGPWEFCAGRHLSRRQMRDCTEHLMKAAGVKYHRDLNMDSKIYELMCMEPGHTYIDGHGSTYSLPRGTKGQCGKIVQARANIEALLKRQVTTYKTNTDHYGHITPPMHEMEGSHNIPCGELDIGCRR